MWYSDDTGYIALDLTADIPHQETRTVDGTALSPKRDESHCSLFALRKNISDQEEERRIAGAVKDYLQEHYLQFAGLGDERYLCRKDDRVTIVAPVHIDGIDEFVGFIQTLIPAYVPPFPHVTLLKSETAEHGISVNSMKDTGACCTHR